MANAEHLAILRQGASNWNDWRSANPTLQPDLSAAFICGPDASGEIFRPSDSSNIAIVEPSSDWMAVSGAILFNANLSGADLRGADLRKAILYNAELGGANLTGADLSGANLNEAKLGGADLIDATLSGASFIGADLSGAKLDRATIDRAIFSNADLSDAKLRGAVLAMANLVEADLTGADLSGADLEHAILVQTILNGATLVGCKVYGTSVWGVELDGAIQQGLRITPNHETSITVDNLKVAQFVYLVLNNKEIRDVIDTVGQKIVLILGRFSPGRKEVLDAIADQLRQKDFLPVIFDFEKSKERDFTETIKILAGLSLFVIADITNPKSSPLELQATVPDYMIPFVPIIEKGQEPFSMFADLHNKYRWVLKPKRYDTKEVVAERLEEKVIKPALELRKTLLAARASSVDTEDM